MPEGELRIELAFGDHDGVLDVLALRGREALSEPFAWEVDFTAEDLDLEAAPLARVHLHLETPDGQERHVDAACADIAFVPVPSDADTARLRYRATLVPAGALVLGHRRGFRLFQKKSVPEIVEAVWKAAGLDPSWLERKALQATYPPRDLCCQYDETEWDFVSRLLEDEGIAYTFRHEADRHVLELHDATRDVAALPGEPLPFNPEPLSAADAVAAWHWRSTARLAPSRAVVDDHDFEHPTRALRKEATAKDAVERLFYEAPAGYTVPREGERRAKVRLEEQRRLARTATFETSLLAAAPGRRFELTGHPADDGHWLLTSVDVHVRVRGETVEGPLVDAGEQSVRLSATCMPRDLPFRPPRTTPRPRATGLQTARVTGPKGQEIHCDAHGRVKLQFHWDRDGTLDDASSAWVRVSQPHTTGAILIPRVGWEVLVDFEEGDPDRPICLGRLWNATSPPPVQLPAGRTQTVHGSHSSPGAGKANEVVFEDSAGAEQMHVRGAHDVAVTAGNDKVWNVGHDFTKTVHGARTVEVAGNRTVTVTSNLARKIGGDETLTVGAARSVDVSGSATEEGLADRTSSIGAAHLVQVGNPAQALLDVLKKAAITAATGAAAAAASQAEAALLGPMMPVLQKARAALGQATKVTGPAAALLGGDHPQLAGLDHATKALAGAPGAQDAAQLATGVVARALGLGGPPPPSGSGTSEGAAERGAGGGGADGAAEAAEAATTGGAGTWSTIVAGAVKETVGGAAAVNSVGGISLSVGKNSTETVGAARVEAIGGGKSEETKGAKIETVGGLYKADIRESLAINAGAAIAENVAASVKHRVTGSHAVSAKAAIALTAPRLKLKAGSTITLTCGSTKVVLSSSGISLDGGSTLNIKASTVELDEGVLGGP